MPGIRVIAGEAKGRRLKMVPGEGTRPITDRVKESLFNILGEDVIDAHILDLFAGTGSVGIEALSRGAARAVFVENGPVALRTIHHNLQLTDFDEYARVIRANVFDFLNGEPSETFDYIHVAPPQYHNLWVDTLKLLDTHPAWANPDGLVCAQIDPKEYVEVKLQHFKLTDQRRYGTTLLAFYEKQSA
jgi:16S rRNA (guanine(966)-N(2))-methyltransferase RsmD